MNAAITVLDGAMGGEIQARIPAAAHGLWSATALVEKPELVVELHREYIDAGADVITTNTYATVPSYLGKGGMAGRFEELTGLAARLARKAANQAGGHVRVAGSLPPLDESYRWDLVPKDDEAGPIYRRMVGAMAADVDLFLCETMSCAREARCAASEALDHGGGKPVYVSWTLGEEPGTGLRSGETIAEAFAALDGLDVDAFLFNCTHPEAIEAGLAELKALTDKPLGCYPNRLNRVPPGWTLDNEKVVGLRDDLPVELYVESIQRSIDHGATIVGGCCGIGPRYIQAMSEIVRGAAASG